MIIVNVPTDSAHTIRETIGKSGGGTIGEYSYCSFSVLGTGRFIPSQNAAPTIGSQGRLESVPEERIEVVCSAASVPIIVRAIRKSHPYEEPSVFAYPLLDI